LNSVTDCLGSATPSELFRHLVEHALGVHVLVTLGDEGAPVICKVPAGGDANALIGTGLIALAAIALLLMIEDPGEPDKASSSVSSRPIVRIVDAESVPALRGKVAGTLLM